MAPLSPAGWLHLLFFGAVVPIMVLRTKRSIEAGAGLPPFHRHIAFASLQLVALGGASILVARVERIDLFPGRMPPSGAWISGVALYAAAVVFMAPRWRRAVERRERVLQLFTPRSRRDRRLWILASAVAGASEEITWRGVQFALLWRLTGDMRAAGAACAVMFGAAHIVQGRAASAAIVLFALAFQALVVSSGSLYVAMLVHFAYDVTAGLTYGRLSRRLEPPAPGGRPSPAGAPAGGEGPESRS